MSSSYTSWCLYTAAKHRVRYLKQHYKKPTSVLSNDEAGLQIQIEEGVWDGQFESLSNTICLQLLNVGFGLASNHVAVFS